VVSKWKSIKSVLDARLFPRDGPPRYIQKPRLITGLVGMGCFLLYMVLSELPGIQPLCDKHPSVVYWMSWVIILTTLSIWIIWFEIPRIWKKERDENRQCWNCGEGVTGIPTDTCPSCGFKGVERGIVAAQRTRGVFWLGSICRRIQRRHSRPSIM